MDFVCVKTIDCKQGAIRAVRFNGKLLLPVRDFALLHGTPILIQEPSIVSFQWMVIIVSVAALINVSSYGIRLKDCI